MPKLWMRPAERAVEPPYFAVFRNRFELSEPKTLRFIYSADERASLFCDGKRVTDGPQRGTTQRWFSSAVELPLSQGSHVLAVRLFAFGRSLTAYGQMSISPGLFIEEESGVFSKDWECQVCMGCSFAGSKTDWGSYAHILTDEDFNWLAVNGEGGIWTKPRHFEDDRNLVASTLPPMRHEKIHDYHQTGNVFLFENYVCAYGDYVFSGVGEVRLRWAEPGCEKKSVDDAFLKGSKPGDPYPYFSGPGDRFRLPGGRVSWQDYWWHAGMALEVTLWGDARLESASFFRTGYPLVIKKSLKVAGDERMTRLLRKSWATLEACCFETLMDCPYYEQLQYISDSRFDLLNLYELCNDVRMAENVLCQLAEGQHPDGFLSCRYPTKDSDAYMPKFGELYRLHIPCFTAFFIQMLHDFAKLRRNDALVAALLPAARRASAYLAGALGDDGLLHVPGWNFIDWLDNWNGGVPPECENGEGCTLNLIYLLSLKDLADLERSCGSLDEAIATEGLSEKLSNAIYTAYYDKATGRFFENKSRKYYSEHAQVFALLALNEKSVIRSLCEDALDECGIAFSFYYLEACRSYNLDELFKKRLEKYLSTADSPGLCTMPELFPNTWWLRSDCHAWGSHILYHHFAKGSILNKISSS